MTSCQIKGKRFLKHIFFLPMAFKCYCGFVTLGWWGLGPEVESILHSLPGTKHNSHQTPTTAWTWGISLSCSVNPISPRKQYCFERTWVAHTAPWIDCISFLSYMLYMSGYPGFLKLNLLFLNSRTEIGFQPLTQSTGAIHLLEKTKPRCSAVGGAK